MVVRNIRVTEKRSSITSFSMTPLRMAGMQFTVWTNQSWIWCGFLTPRLANMGQKGAFSCCLDRVGLRRAPLYGCSKKGLRHTQGPRKAVYTLFIGRPTTASECLALCTKSHFI